MESCPWCGEDFTPDSIALLPNAQMPADLRIACANWQCEFSGDHPLPIVAVDEPLYRRLPAFLIATSVQALTYRCKDLGIFSNTLFRMLFDEFSRRGWRSPPYEEPCAMKGEKPRRFERLCYRALVEGAVSDAKAAELLGISVHELNRRVEEPPDVEVVPA